MEKTVKYGVGEQSFEVMRERDLLYVDKTRFVEKIINSGTQYYFLGRPRRFGKSLFLSTLKCFFQGRRELFKGLYADTIDWDWEPYPVLYVDLNIGKYEHTESLYQVIGNLLSQWEREYEVSAEIDNISVRFRNIIEAAYKKTGKRVVILVDEYDKPLVNNIDNRDLFETFRNLLASFYSNFKSSAEYIRLVFLTGVSRFGHLSVFSGLNNILDISFDDDYSEICGITEAELSDYFDYGIETLATVLGKSKDEVRTEIKRWYDGYRFSAHGLDIYNPFSLVCLMEKKDFQNFWIYSGQATLLAKELVKYRRNLSEIVNLKCTLTTLKGIGLDNPTLPALLYQTGYLTIKDYNNQRKIYGLGMPNQEVVEGFLSFLMPYYSSVSEDDTMPLVYKMIDFLSNGDAEGFMRQLEEMFGTVPYDMAMEREQNIHNALYILMKLMSLEVETEYHTTSGRIDLLVKTNRYIYIIELKLDGSAGEAIAQINERNYVAPFLSSGKGIIKIGVNFSSKSRTISDWIIEKENP